VARILTATLRCRNPNEGHPDPAIRKTSKIFSIRVNWPVPLSFHVCGNKSCAALECLIARHVGKKRRSSRRKQRASELERDHAPEFLLSVNMRLVASPKGASPRHTRPCLGCTFETSIFDHSHVPGYPERFIGNKGDRKEIRIIERDREWYTGASRAIARDRGILSELTVYRCC